MCFRGDPETLLAVLIMLGSAALVAFLGHRISGGEVWLISGYHPESVEDEEGVAHLVGTTTVALAVVTSVYAVAMLVVEPALWFWLSYVGIFVVALLVVQLRGRRYGP